MVRSMVAGVAGLKTHQSKLDTIGNNIANVNTWGFKSYSFNFKDSMYSTSINGAAGSALGGGAGGRNPSQVGFGTTTSSISTEFGKGAMSPSSRELDCYIDDTGFFLVGNMINGSFTDIAESGLSLSRVGIFAVDSNGYLVDDQRSYVYGYGLVEGTGIPETPAVKGEWSVAGEAVTFGTGTITIAGVTVDTTYGVDNMVSAVNDWAKKAGKVNAALEGFQFSVAEYNDTANPPTVDLKIVAGKSGDSTAANGTLGGFFAGLKQTVIGTDRVPSVAAQYSDELSTIQIPIDPDTNERYNIRSYSIQEDGTIIGVDDKSRAIAIGQLALVHVENVNGLEKTEGYYYKIGANAGSVQADKPNGGSTGRILGSYLEMANVDLANEFSQMITTQRGFQANSKIITVTDQMLEELVNMKR